METIADKMNKSGLADFDWKLSPDGLTAEAKAYNEQGERIWVLAREGTIGYGNIV